METAHLSMGMFHCNVMIFGLIYGTCLSWFFRFLLVGCAVRLHLQTDSDLDQCECSLHFHCLLCSLLNLFLFIIITIIITVVIIIMPAARS